MWDGIRELPADGSAETRSQLERVRVLVQHLHGSTLIARATGRTSVSMDVDDADELVQLLADSVRKADALLGGQA